MLISSGLFLSLHLVGFNFVGLITKVTNKD